MANPPPNRGWRKGADDGGASRGGKRGWQQDASTGTASSRPKLSKKHKLTLALGGIGAILAILVGVIFWPKGAQPVRVVVLGADYEDTRLAVPANPYAKPLLRDLEDWAKKSAELDNGTQRLSVQGTELTSAADPYAEAIKEAREKGTPTFVLFINAHGGADEKGAYLLSKDANLRDLDRARMRLDKLFEDLKLLPEGMNKVLIVDAAQVPADWDLGMVHNDFARAFLAEARNAKVPNLVVLAACDEDQRSWTSEDWRQSIFAHYVAEGLKGAADENHDSRITALELHKYVASNVKHWTRHNREALQEPVLVGDESLAGNVEMHFLPPGYSYAAPELPKLKDVDMLAAWTESQRLAGSTPPPTAYAPHLWREYLDTLLRAERLYRADDTAAAGRHLQTLNELGGRIERAGLSARDSSQTTLAMPAALGRSLPEDQEKKLATDVSKLWEDREPAAFKKKLLALQEAAPEKWQKQLLRVRMSALILERIAAQPDANLEPGSRILAALDETLNPRPAEVQFTVLLNRDLAEKRPPAALLTRALEVRQRAEEAALGAGGRSKDGFLAAYSEQVHPWVREQIVAGDQKRRLAQDLLLAADEDSWKQAGTLLDEADKSYEAAQTNAVQVRKAIRARDEALVVLPYYTAWLARERDHDQWKVIDDQLVPLWKKTHELRQALETSDPKAPANKIKALGDRGDEVAGGVADLRSTFDKRAHDVAGSGLQKRWHDIEAVLAVPFIEPDLRRQLLSWSRKISATLNEQSAKEASAAGGVTKEENAKQVRESAQRQGRLALEMIGEEEFKRLEHEKYSVVENWIKTADESAWWKSLVKVGDEIGFRLTHEAIDADKLAQDGHQLPLDKAAEPLRVACGLGHRLDGAGAASLGSVDPVGEERRLQLHDLLLAEAGRTFGDYLAAEDGKVPYYRTVGLIFTRDAADLVGKDATDLSDEQKAKRLAGVKKTEDLLKSPDDVVIQLFDAGEWKPGPATLDLTAEKPEERLYRVHAPTNVPDGYPVVWPKPGPQVMVVRDGSTEKEILARSVLEEIGTKRQDVIVRPFAVKQVEGPARSEKTDQVMRGLYRGRRLEHRTEIALFQKPDLIVLQPEVPRTARVAVQAGDGVDAAGNTAIAIVLDCSGSMGDVNSKTPRSKWRYTRALTELRTVLKNLPAGVYVSLRVFSDYDDNPKNWSRPLRKLKKWDPEQINEVMDQLEKLIPWQETPLVRAIWRAKREDFKYPSGEDFKGARTIVVLTDGADNLFAKDADLTDIAPTIPDFLEKTFKDSNVALHVVGFEVSDQDRKDQETFIKGINKLGPEASYVDAADTKQLAAALRRAMLQMHFWIKADGGPDTGLPQEGADISRPGKNLQWVTDIPPGTYRVRIRTNREYEQRIRLAAGDSLALRLVPVGKGIGFQRYVYAESFVGGVGRDPKMVKKDDWLMAVLQNQRKVSGPLEGDQMMVTIERPGKVVDENTRIELQKPGFVWFEVPAPDKDNPVNLRWYPLADYPAPAYSLDTSPWPRSAPVSLDAYWSDEIPASAKRVLRNDTDDFNSVIDIANRSVDGVADEKVKIVIESVRHERQTVERKAPPDFNKPGETDKDVDCLVVRLRFPAGKPYFVQLPESLGTVGQEHRFYSQAGKYTGVFWNVTKEQAQALKALTLVSVEGAKKKAISVPKLELGKPEADWGRPLKPPDNVKK